MTLVGSLLGGWKRWVGNLSSCPACVSDFPEKCLPLGGKAGSGYHGTKMQAVVKTFSSLCFPLLALSLLFWACYFAKCQLLLLYLGQIHSIKCRP